MVQLRLATELTSEEYVRQEGWRTATLRLCPAHPEGGCRFRRHSSYERKDPAGCRIPRWYCRDARQTFSLLPDFLAARMPGELAEVERAVVVREQTSIESAAEELRGEIELPGAVRWLGRRTRLVTAGIVALLGLLPDLLARCEPTVVALRDRLGAEPVLPVVRALAAGHLHALPPPLGFGPRPVRRRRVLTGVQHNPGPDPPAGAG